jgi:hypothetical protein
MRHYVLRAVGAVLLIAIASYIADYTWLKSRMIRGLNPYDTVTIQRVYVIPQKGNKAEYVPADPDQQICVRSLFPHSANQPCWYLRRHTVQQLKM